MSIPITGGIMLDTRHLSPKVSPLAGKEPCVCVYVYIYIISTGGTDDHYVFS